MTALLLARGVIGAAVAGVAGRRQSAVDRRRHQPRAVILRAVTGSTHRVTPPI